MLLEMAGRWAARGVADIARALGRDRGPVRRVLGDRRIGRAIERGDRVRVGLPVDLENWVITIAEARRLSSGIRFGGGLSFGGRGP